MRQNPQLEQFYQSTIRKHPTDIALLTIACRDTPEKVSAYMAEKNYSFPVALSNTQVENAYRVNSYPTKFLITPEGGYVLIPFGADWVNFVKEYSGL